MDPDKDRDMSHQKGQVLEINPKPVDSFYPSPRKVARASRWDVPPSPTEEGERPSKRFKFTDPEDANITESEQKEPFEAQFSFSQPEGMDVDMAHSDEISQTPEPCASMLSHTVLSSSPEKHSSLLCHLAPVVPGPSSTSLAHQAPPATPAPSTSSHTLLPPQPGAASAAHMVHGQQVEGGASASAAHTVQGQQAEGATSATHAVLSSQEAGATEASHAVVVQQEEGATGAAHTVSAPQEDGAAMAAHTVNATDAGEEEGLLQGMLEEVEEGMEVEDSPVGHPMEASTLESSDLVAHIVSTFGLGDEQPEVPSDQGMKEVEENGKVNQGVEENGETNKKDQEEEQMEEDDEEGSELLAAQRRAEEAEAEAEEAMNMENAGKGNWQEESGQTITVADILEKEEEEIELNTVENHAMPDLMPIKITNEPTVMSSNDKLEADNADVIRALSELSSSATENTPQENTAEQPTEADNMESRVMADTLATLATLASLVNGDETMDINSAMAKMQPEAAASGEVQDVELILTEDVATAENGQQEGGDKVGEDGILEQVQDVEIVVNPTATQALETEGEPSMVSELLAEPEKKLGSTDDVEKQLEAMHKEEEEMQEQVLVEDEDMIVGQITSMDELDQQLNQHHMKPEEEPGLTLHNVTKLPPNAGSTRIVQQAELLKLSDQPSLDVFSEVEDLVIHGLDTISPFDAKFISEHMVKREEAQIEKRLNEMDFRKLSFAFQKLPILIFEVVFVNDGILRSRSLMLLTEKQLVSLKCTQEVCNHGPGIEQLKMVYNPKSRFGIDTGELCEFIVTNIPGKHMQNLRRNKAELEQMMDDSKINFHKSAISTFTRKDMKMMNKSSLTMESIKKADAEPIRIDETGKLSMNSEHEDTLRRIVHAVGKNRWEDATKLLLAVYDHEIDFDVEDAEIYARIAGYYQLRLDPDQDIGVFSEDEDKCIIYMHKLWHKAMSSQGMWKHIARHLPGRTANQVKNRFNRKAQGDLDLCLENIKKYAFEPSIPAVFENDMAHAFNLTVVPKSTGKDTTDITTKLQCEARFLVVGTYKQIFLLPCKETALRCTHQNVTSNSFTYDSTR